MTAAFTVKDGRPCGEPCVSYACTPPLSQPCVRPDPAVILPKHWIVISTDLSGPPAWMCQCSSLSLGVGDGGEGGGEQAVASIFCEERTRLVSQEWKGIESLLFPFCPSGTAHRREYTQCFLELLSFSGSKYPQTCCGFIHLYSPCVKEQS